MQADSSDGLSGLLAWIMGNLDQDLTLEALAARTSQSKRQFCRTFKSAFGATPADVVESLRLDQARELLMDPHASVQNVASAVGFGNPDSFRRAFVRRFGVAPSGYRGQF